MRTLNRWKDRWQKAIPRARLFAAFAFAMLVVLFLTQRHYRCDWTGFGECPTTDTMRPEKTLWDWMELLIVPLVIAGGGFMYNRSEKRTEREITQDNQREAALQAYFDRMAELLLREPGLRDSVEDDEIRSVARSRTLTVLSRLDDDRKGSVVQFLFESALISRDKLIVLLFGASLRGAMLYGTNLERAILSGTNLENANLGLANLENADLELAHLENADLELAHLENANLELAHLENANLRFANLRFANLRFADLKEANLEGANLEGADLEGANLDYCQNLSRSQLAQAKSIKDASLPVYIQT